MAGRGHETGHHQSGGYDWGVYLEALVATEGSLVAVAERLCASRGYADEIASVERALRRLRGRGTADGGRWGTRLVRQFGMPGEVERRLAWMGAYHSSFIDLPVPVCEDLVRAWDHPPITLVPTSRGWIRLASGLIALRRRELEVAEAAFAQAKLDEATAGPEARIERMLGDAFIASKRPGTKQAIPPFLTAVESLVPTVADDYARACLFARWVDHCAYELNQGRAATFTIAPSTGGRADPAAAESLYLRIPAAGPPFALARRANGLAYAAWKQGRVAEGAQWAREAAEHAGDGGHVRMRTMALAMLVRILPGEEGARQRGAAMAARLEDETLRLRLRRREGS